jgi:hypothetical protein
VGCADGIGLHTATELAKLGATVLVHGRLVLISIIQEKEVVSVFSINSWLSPQTDRNWHYIVLKTSILFLGAYSFELGLIYNISCMVHQL